MRNSTQNGAYPNPFQYGGQVGYYTYPNGLILCGSRWYDPDLGRWLSRDPIGIAGGPNLFEYCGSDPINYLDPWGLDFLGISSRAWRWGFGTGLATFALTRNLQTAVAAGVGVGGSGQLL